MFHKVLFLLFSSALIFVGARKLEKYNVDPSGITVSGLSAGGAMAVQYHYIYSREILGAGIFAGLPYGCAKAGLSSATLCMYSPEYSTPIDTMIGEANSQANAQKIDSLEYLSGDKAYIFHGSSDYTVFPPNEKRIKEMYEHFGVQVQSETSFNAGHGLPTDHYGGGCSSSSSPYIMNCNYKGVHHMFNFLYGGDLQVPDNTVTPGGDFFEFDQSEFYSTSPSLASMGYAYVPTNCTNGSSIPCRLHLAFHGCLQSSGHVGDVFAQKTGYLQSAELNNIIILFPQASTSTGNPNACFEWWPYLTSNFLNKDGGQMDAIHKMMRRVIAG